jgi:hypothetical protein
MFFSFRSVFENLELYYLVIRPFLSTSNLEKTLKVAIKQETAEAAIDSIFETFDNIFSRALFFVAK